MAADSPAQPLRGAACVKVSSSVQRAPQTNGIFAIRQQRKESDKEKELQETAQELERESREKAHLHHQFAHSVALIQVAISLSAVAALTRMKSIWWLSMLVGGVGLFLFALGTIAPK